MKRLRISLFVLAIALTVTGNAFSLFATVNRSGIPLLQNIGSRKSTVKLYPGMVEYRPNSSVVDVDVDARTVKTEFETVRADTPT